MCGWGSQLSEAAVSLRAGRSVMTTVGAAARLTPYPSISRSVGCPEPRADQTVGAVVNESGPDPDEWPACAEFKRGPSRLLQRAEG
jgi:hypothetical protein